MLRSAVSRSCATTYVRTSCPPVAQRCFPDLRCDRRMPERIANESASFDRKQVSPGLQPPALFVTPRKILRHPLGRSPGRPPTRAGAHARTTTYLLIRATEARSEPLRPLTLDMCASHPGTAEALEQPSHPALSVPHSHNFDGNLRQMFELHSVPVLFGSKLHTEPSCLRVAQLLTPQAHPQVLHVPEAVHPAPAAHALTAYHRGCAMFA